MKLPKPTIVPAFLTAALLLSGCADLDYKVGPSSAANNTNHSPAKIAIISPADPSEVLGNMGEDPKVTIKPGDKIQALAFLDKEKELVGFNKRGLYIKINDRWYRAPLWGGGFATDAQGKTKEKKRARAYKLAQSREEIEFLLQGKYFEKLENMAKAILGNGGIQKIGSIRDPSVIAENEPKQEERPKQKTTVKFCTSKIDPNCNLQEILNLDF